MVGYTSSLLSVLDKWNRVEVLPEQVWGRKYESDISDDLSKSDDKNDSVPIFRGRKWVLPEEKGELSAWYFMKQGDKGPAGTEDL